MKRQFRFSLRSLLVVLTVVSLALGLHVRGWRAQKAAVEKIRDQGGWVAYGYQYEQGSLADVPGESPVPAVFRRTLGDDFFHSVAEVSFFIIVEQNANGGRGVKLTVRRNDEPLDLSDLLVGVPKVRCLRLWGPQIDDDDLIAVARLENLESLVIDNAVNITDRGVAALKGNAQLTWIVLADSQITDASLEVFASMPNLETLSLDAGALTDAGLARLADHQRLAKVSVRGAETQSNQITDEGIEVLRRVPRLEYVGVADTQVTAEGAATFMAERPGVEVGRKR